MLSKDMQSSVSLLLERTSHVLWTSHGECTVYFCHIFACFLPYVSHSTQNANVCRTCWFPMSKIKKPWNVYFFGNSWELLMHEEQILGSQSTLMPLATDWQFLNLLLMIWLLKLRLWTSVIRFWHFLNQTSSFSMHSELAKPAWSNGWTAVNYLLKAWTGFYRILHTCFCPNSEWTLWKP